MSYAAALAVQEIVYDALTGSAALTALVADRIYDEPPHADAPDAPEGSFVLIGAGRAEDWSAQALSGAIHDLEIEVHSTEAGFSDAKEIAGVVSDILTGPLPPHAGARVVSARFRAARAVRPGDGERRIDLRFRLHVEL